MARKTILYEVVVKNGHGTNAEFHVGQIKAHLKKILETSDVKVESIKSLGQKTVDVYPGDDLETKFDVKINESERFTFNRSCNGYNFLRDKFQLQVDKLEKEVNDCYE